jgi:predicted  nucleic acid-binding Zn-ribbon protein
MDAERIAKLEIQVEGIKDDVRELKSDIKEVHSRITTGNREIMDKIDLMDHRMEQRMISSADVAKKQHEEIQEEIKNDIRKIADRVDVLERWRWMIIGGATVFGYIVSHIPLPKLF